MKRQTWWSPRALRLHAVILVILPTFAGLCIWQIQRALDGNGLSWAYVFEWPFFAGYAIYMWWRFLHEGPAPSSETRPTTERTNGPAHRAAENASSADPEEAERAAYNDYLSALSTRGKRKQWR